MPGPPRTPDERELEHLQAKVTEGERARERLTELAFRMWMGGYTQKDIAERLDRADRRAGGDGISAGTAQKMLYRARKAREDGLLAEAGVR
jgi:transposase